jgi:glycogen debranching enzyme
MASQSDVKYVREKNLDRFSYFLSNRKCFFHRFADSGFKNKWTGFWIDNVKLLDYFSVKADGISLSPENCRKIEYDGSKCIAFHKIGGNEIRETIFVPENRAMVIVEILSSKSVDFELEVAANIRKRHENVTRREYKAARKGSSVEIRNSLGSLWVGFLGRFGFESNSFYKTHYPSGEQQTCFLPGNLTSIGKRLVFSFSRDRDGGIGNYKSLLKSREDHYRKLTEGFYSDNSQLAKAFRWSIAGIDMLRKSFGKRDCFYAGLPWFQQFWGRDVFWVLPSLISLGYFREARDALELFSEKNRDGGIPNFVSKEENIWNSIDSTLLWIISLYYYVLWSGDLKFLKRMKPRFLNAIGFLFEREDDDNFIQHDQYASETWMDTLKRDSKAVEIQALYFRALECAENLLLLLRTKSWPMKAVNQRVFAIRESFDRVFFERGFYVDRISESKDYTRTANALVPLMSGFSSHSSEVLYAMETSNFTTQKGIRSRSLAEQGFSPGGYHTGSVWSLTTAWMCAAEFMAKRTEQGWKYLRYLMDDMEQDSLGCVGECWDSYNFNPTGCSLQLWGSGFIPSLVEEYMLGIRVDAFISTIYVSPQMPREVSYIRCEVPVGNKRVLLTFKRNEGKIGVFCDNRSVKIVNA